MRLIDADDLKKYIEKLQNETRDMKEMVRFDGILAILDSQPTANPMRGEWNESNKESLKIYKCSCCGYWVTIFIGTPEENGYNYCPGCGAKMEDEND